VGLTEAVGAGPIALDTAIFIYLIEEHPTYLPAVRPLFAGADRGKLEIVTSAITLLEVLVVPYWAGNLPVAARYEDLLTRSRGVRLIDIDRAQLRAAAQLRAVHGVRAPDALRLAAALTARCTVFVTNGRRLPPLPGLRVVQLAEFA
jgi:predicted nucleic acid-binding protein